MMRILLIEDEEPARIGLRRRLGKLGHTVDEAETAGQAVERMRQEAYDLLLLDIMLPEEGDMLGERPVILYSRFGLCDGWAHQFSAYARCYTAEDALKVGTNLLVYVMQ